MARTTRPHARQPGTKAADTERSDDKAIAAGKAGKAHKVSKHPDVETLPKSKVRGDPERPADAAVNAKKEMTYAKAMDALADRKALDKLRKIESPTEAQAERMAELEKTALTRNVLTEQGWVCVNREPPAQARA